MRTNKIKMEKEKREKSKRRLARRLRTRGWSFSRDKDNDLVFLITHKLLSKINGKAYISILGDIERLDLDFGYGCDMSVHGLDEEIKCLAVDSEDVPHIVKKLEQWEYSVRGDKQAHNKNGFSLFSNDLKLIPILRLDTLPERKKLGEYHFYKSDKENLDFDRIAKERLEDGHWYSFVECEGYYEKDYVCVLIHESTLKKLDKYSFYIKSVVGDVKLGSSYGSFTTMNGSSVGRRWWIMKSEVNKARDVLKSADKKLSAGKTKVKVKVFS